MEWYFYLIIVYGIIVAINTFLLFKNYELTWKEYKVGLIVMYIIGLVIIGGIMPFTWFISGYVFCKQKLVRYDIFNIGKLTESNKETLKQLGFSEVVGNVGDNNVEYSGFKSGDVVVQNNGRCFIRHYGTLSVREMHLKAQLKAMPTTKSIETLKADLAYHEAQLTAEPEYRKQRIADITKQINDLEGELKHE